MQEDFDNQGLDEKIDQELPMKKMIEEYLDEVKNNKQIIQEWMAL